MIIPPPMIPSLLHRNDKMLLLVLDEFLFLKVLPGCFMVENNYSISVLDAISRVWGANNEPSNAHQASIIRALI